MRPILRIVTFITLSAVVGLAAAFVVIMIRPELVARRAPASRPAPRPPRRPNRRRP